jgi:hypothetical protein
VDRIEISELVREAIERREEWKKAERREGEKRRRREEGEGEERCGEQTEKKSSLSFSLFRYFKSEIESIRRLDRTRN